MDVQAKAERIRRKKRWQTARVVGVDGIWLGGTGVMVAVDLGDGELLAIGAVDEKDLAAVTRWLKRLKQEHHIGAIVTDDLRMYRTITDKLGLGHQVCRFHVRCWVGRVCWELGQKLPEEWLWMIDRIKVIMEDLPRMAANSCWISANRCLATASMARRILPWTTSVTC